MAKVLFLRSTTSRTVAQYDIDLADALRTAGHIVKEKSHILSGDQLGQDLIFVSSYFSGDPASNSLIRLWHTQGIPVVCIGGNNLTELHTLSRLAAVDPLSVESVNFDEYADSEAPKLTFVGSPLYPGLDYFYLRTVSKATGPLSEEALSAVGDHPQATWKELRFNTGASTLYGVLGFTEDALDYNGHPLKANLVWIANSQAPVFDDLLGSDGYKEMVVRSVNWAVGHVDSLAGVSPAICIEPATDYKVTGHKREYAIVGDAFFASINGEVEPPQWLADFVAEFNYNVWNIINGDVQDLKNSLWQWMDELDVQINAYDARISGYISDTESHQQMIQTLNSKMANAEATIISAWDTFATEDFALAKIQERIEAELNDGDIRAAIDGVNLVIAGIASDLEDQYQELYGITGDIAVAFGLQIETLQATLNDDIDAKIETTKTVIASEVLAAASQKFTLQSTFNGSMSSINSSLNTLNTGQAATASSLNTLTSTLRGGYSSVSAYREAMILADTNNANSIAAIGSKYGVKLTATGINPDGTPGALLVGGFEILNTGATVTAGFDVDQFWIGRPLYNGVKPFFLADGMIYIETAMIRNGNITEAHIQNGAIVNAKIGNGAITNAKIGNGAITNAKIQDAAITNAKIENAAVNTFKIEDKSVTSMHAKESIAQIPTSSRSMITLLTTDPQTTYTGMTGFVVTGNVQYAALAGGTGAELRLLRNGVTYVGNAVGAAVPNSASVTLTVVGFDPSPGTSPTYSLVGRSVAGNSIRFSGPTITVQGGYR